MKILRAFWFSGGSTVGIVVGQDEITGKRKAYMNLVPGFDEDRDTQLVATRGWPVVPAVLREILELLEGSGEEVSSGK